MRKSDKAQTPLLTSRTMRLRYDSDRFGRFTEWIARAMGTPAFLVGLTAFCALWMVWNVCAPEQLRFDRADLGYTALTLMLSLQASYAAPLILLAQNRQDDRDRFSIKQDRERAERNLADTEYLAREVVTLRLALAELICDQQENHSSLLKQLDTIEQNLISLSETKESP